LPVATEPTLFPWLCNHPSPLSQMTSPTDWTPPQTPDPSAILAEVEAAVAAGHHSQARPMVSGFTRMPSRPSRHWVACGILPHWGTGTSSPLAATCPPARVEMHDFSSNRNSGRIARPERVSGSRHHRAGGPGLAGACRTRRTAGGYPARNCDGILALIF
jgi:hypothetical protein